MRKFRRNGLLWLGSKNGSEIRSNLVKKYSIEHTKLCGDEIEKQFPNLKYNQEWNAIFEPNAGTMLADVCLKTVQVILLFIKMLSGKGDNFSQKI